MSGTRRKPGSMGPFIEGFGLRLVELGYTPGSTRGLLKGVGQFGGASDFGMGLCVEECPVGAAGVEQ